MKKHKHQHHDHKKEGGCIKGSPLVITHMVAVTEPFSTKTVALLTKVYGADWRTNLRRSQKYDSTVATKGTP